MARPPRDIEPGGFYHVTSRGNDGQTVFHDDYSRRDFLDLLVEQIAAQTWTCFAYCLMTNHFHLVLQVAEAGLSRGMQTLVGEHARRTNRRLDRTGHLFRNRFHAEAVEGDGHLLESCRYVVLNPVRAGICSDPTHWPWSSYRASAGREFPKRLPPSRRLLELFADEPAKAFARYRAFVTDGLEAPV